LTLQQQQQIDFADVLLLHAWNSGAQQWRGAGSVEPTLLACRAVSTSHALRCFGCSLRIAAGPSRASSCGVFASS
jgi:hypothetical protein